jgi:hypothetical protein
MMPPHDHARAFALLIEEPASNAQNPDSIN